METLRIGQLGCGIVGSAVLRLLDRHLSNKEIAEQLGIEVATVKNHVHNLLEKLKVHRRVDAVASLKQGAAR